MADKTCNACGAPLLKPESSGPWFCPNGHTTLNQAHSTYLFGHPPAGQPVVMADVEDEDHDEAYEKDCQIAREAAHAHNLKHGDDPIEVAGALGEKLFVEVLEDGTVFFSN
jgi:hypothetical protein